MNARLFLSRIIGDRQKYQAELRKDLKKLSPKGEVKTTEFLWLGNVAWKPNVKNVTESGTKESKGQLVAGKEDYLIIANWKLKWDDWIKEEADKTYDLPDSIVFTTGKCKIWGVSDDKGRMEYKIKFLSETEGKIAKILGDEKGAKITIGQMMRDVNYGKDMFRELNLTATKDDPPKGRKKESDETETSSFDAESSSSDFDEE